MFLLFICRIALICSDLKLSQASLYHEKAAGEAHISGLEQAMYVFSLQKLHLVEVFWLHLRSGVGKKYYKT